jgi:phosphatase NudJ
MPRDPIPTWFFVKVVVRQGDRFLLVQERRFNRPWHVPAGRAEPGETLVAAALRETLEESAVPVILDGILRVEHSPHSDKAYLGAIFLAHPAADVPPKSTPDEESLAAGWFTLEEAERLPLREQDILELLQHVHHGGPMYPISLLAGKGEAFKL